MYIRAAVNSRGFLCPSSSSSSAGIYQRAEVVVLVLTEPQRISKGVNVKIFDNRDRNRKLCDVFEFLTPPE